MNIKALIAILLTGFTLVAFSETALSQTTPVLQSTPFQKGRFITTDGRKIRFNSLIMSGNICKYQINRIDGYQEIATNNIGQIDKETGNSAALYGATFGLAGLLGGYLGVAEANAEGNGSSIGVSVNGSAKAITIVSSTAICAIVGVLVGNGQKKYTTVYNNKTLTGLNSNFNFNLVFNNNQKGLGIRYMF